MFDDLRKHFSYRRKKDDGKNEKKLIDLTDEFVQFLRNGATNTEFSFLALQYGTGGGGKTAGAFIIISILLLSDPKRKLALWQTPPDLELIVKKKLIMYMGGKRGEEMAARVRTITFTHQIEENDIILVDEGVITLNAKEALTNDAKEFEKFTTGARHMRVIIIVNSITLGVIKAYRLIAHLEIYKLITKKMIKELKSDFLKEHLDKVMNLEPWESLIESSHKKWKNKEGFISMKLSDYCPWYDDEISRSLDTLGSGDISIAKDQMVEKMIDDIASKAIEYFSDKEEKHWANPRVIRAWMRKYHNEIWREIGTKSRDIVDTIKLKMLEDGVDIDDLGNDDVEEEPESEYISTEEYDDMMEAPHRDAAESSDPRGTEAMASFFFDCARKAGYNEKQALISSYTVKGYALQDMAELNRIGYSESYITQIRKDMSEKWFGYWAEWWFAVLLGEDPNTAMNDNRPDLITTMPTEYRGHRFETGTIFTIKFRVQKRNAETFYQNGGINNQLKPNFTPEYTEALENGKMYYFAFFNPKWSTDHYFLKLIDPNGPIVVTVEKPSQDTVML
jgi:hypothetical protein